MKSQPKPQKDKTHTHTHKQNTPQRKKEGNKRDNSSMENNKN